MRRGDPGVPASMAALRRARGAYGCPARDLGAGMAWFGDTAQ